MCLFVEPHRGATYDDQLGLARLAEAAGFAGFFRADHYQTFGADPGLPGPTDAWLTLAALARETSHIRLGTLLSSATFRLPGPLAVMVAQVDQMSGGRVELGLGAGWYEQEHLSYGIPFPPLAERMRRLAEQLEIVTGLWRTPVGERFSYAGEFYRLQDAPALPKPVQSPHPPVIVGGRGDKVTPRLAARYATELNAAFLPPAAAAARFARAAEECARLGRPAGQLRCAGGVPGAVGRTDAEARRRAEALHGASGALPPDDATVCGPPEALVERIEQLRQAGASRVYLRLGDLTDLDHVELIAAQVLPKVAG